MFIVFSLLVGYLPPALPLPHLIFIYCRGWVILFLLLISTCSPIERKKNYCAECICDKKYLRIKTFCFFFWWISLVLTKKKENRISYPIPVAFMNNRILSKSLITPKQFPVTPWLSLIRSVPYSMDSPFFAFLFIGSRTNNFHNHSEWQSLFSTLTPNDVQLNVVHPKTEFENGERKQKIKLWIMKLYVWDYWGKLNQLQNGNMENDKWIDRLTRSQTCWHKHSSFAFRMKD